VGWQILTTVGAYLFTGRAVLFVIGLLLGGMLTVASPEAFDIMSQLVSWWRVMMTAIFQ